MKITLEYREATYEIEGKEAYPLVAIEALLKSADLMAEDNSLHDLTSEESATLNYCY